MIVQIWEGGCIGRWCPGLASAVCTCVVECLCLVRVSVCPAEWRAVLLDIQERNFGICDIAFWLLDDWYSIPRWDSNPPRQSQVCYQTSALPPSHHGWVALFVIFAYKTCKKARFWPAIEVCSNHHWLVKIFKTIVARTRLRTIYANPVIFWVPIAGIRCKWSSDQCLITKTNGEKCCVFLQKNIVHPPAGVNTSNLRV